MHSKKLLLTLTLLLALILAGCGGTPTPDTSLREFTPEPVVVIKTATPAPEPQIELPALEEERVSSPDGQVEVTFSLTAGVPAYSVRYAGRDVLRPSPLGFEFADAPPLDRNLTLVKPLRETVDETWEQPWGEQREIRSHYNELRLELAEAVPPHRVLTVVFRVFDDGLGFRYELPAQENLTDFVVTNERTAFAFTGDHEAWWIPAYGDNRYEYLYTHSTLSDFEAAHTPLTMKTNDGLYLSLHEAALTDYAAMTLLGGENNTLHCDLVPWSDGTKVKATTPHQTPWRTLQIAEQPGDLITSYLILNLNEPSKIADVSWIEPGKYVGIWWGMHIDKYTWGSGPHHGATTENARRYIDFAAEHGFDGVLIEGWNVGWDSDWTRYGDRFSFTTPYDDFDIEAVAAYAAEQGVRVIGHHETGAAVHNYEQQMEEAFALYHELGYNTVKTGYVGWGQGIKRRDDQGQLRGLEWHHGQYMVRHYRKVVETAAQYEIMLNVHEPIKDTGIRRTWPNMMTREGARGQEYNAWDGAGGNPPDHTTILPFTRMLAGPFDFTPGIFNLRFDEYREGNRVNTTLAKQLALYVVLYSPLHMAADLPEHYVDQPAFQFIEDVPTDWETTRVLDAAIGDTVTIVRRDRNSDDWYLGSITDENARTLAVPLDFLDAGRAYVAELYRDDPNADWDNNPLAIEIEQIEVDAETELKLELAPGGGAAIRFRPDEE